MADNGLIKDLYRESRVSKAGKDYQVLVLEFSSGYKIDMFLNNEQQFILSNVPIKQ